MVCINPPGMQARIVTEAHYPYRVIYANHAWEELCGWSAEEAIGQSGLSFMQVSSWLDHVTGSFGCTRIPPVLRLLLQKLL